MGQSQTIDALRLSVLQALINTSNFDLLKRTMDLIEKTENPDPAAGSGSNRPPLTQEELEKNVATSRAEFEKGEFITLDKLEEESKSWV